MDTCSTKPKKYQKPFEEYRQIARMVTDKLEPEIEAMGSVAWERVMQVADHDELVYKLTLKYLRQDGYNIGNYKHQFVTK